MKLYSKNLTLLLSAIITSFTFALGQNKIQGYILNKQTGDPVEYVTISSKNYDYGCYTDTKGFYTLYFKSNDDSIRISHLSYSIVKTTVNNLLEDTIIFLEPSLVQINEAVVTPLSMKTKKTEIGFFTKKRKSVHATLYPNNIHAVHIPYPDNADLVSIKSIRFNYEMTFSNYPLRIRLMEVDSMGQVGKDIFLKKLNLNKKPFKIHVAEIDVANYNILMPNEGIIVAFEWIMDRPPAGKKFHADIDGGLDGPYIVSTKLSSLNTRWIGVYYQEKWHKLQSNSTFSVGLNVVEYEKE